MMHNPGRTLVGLVLIVAGVLFLLDLWDYADAGKIIGTWWPVVIMGFGIMALLSSARSLIAAGILMALGAILLIANLGLIPLSAGELFLPLLLIAIGGGILFIRSGRQAGGDQQNSITGFAAFGGQEIVSRAESLRGGTLTALFGGVNLDLRQATIDPEGAGIETFAAFGGIEITVPPGWRVTVSGMPLFGAFEDKIDRATELLPDAPTVRISGVAMFGGVEVKQKAPEPVFAEQVRG